MEKRTPGALAPGAAHVEADLMELSPALGGLPLPLFHAVQQQAHYPDGGLSRARAGMGMTRPGSPEDDASRPPASPTTFGRPQPRGTSRSALHRVQPLGQVRSRD